MGCDIHTIAQIRIDGAWKTYKASVGDDDRDYHSFAVLANVRNGHGFAGVPTSEPWIPIAEPRGLPEDVHLDRGQNINFSHIDQSERQSTRKWLGDHSYSWLSLEELEKWWDENHQKSYMRAGVVAIEEYNLMKEEGRRYPTAWSGGVWGGQVRVVHESELHDLSRATHVKMEWSQPYSDVLRYLKKVLNELRQIQFRNALKSCDIRLVFGFDS